MFPAPIIDIVFKIYIFPIWCDIKILISSGVYHEGTGIFGESGFNSGFYHICSQPIRCWSSSHSVLSNSMSSSIVLAVYM